ncbi:hypothetical protein PFISCL1PPCAC_25780, partial [Pristionchus fissidentatus]
LGLTALLLYAIYRYYRFVAQFPKGPTPLPFIGNFLEFDFGRQDLTFERLSEGFGGVCTIFNPRPTVHIKDYALIKEAFVDKGDDFAGRPVSKAQRILRDFTDNGGVISSNGANWREQRRTAITILRDFGMGKNIMEELVKSSLQEYLACLENVKDMDNVNMRWPVQIMVANIINEVLFGFRYKYDDCAPLTRYVDDLNDIFEQLPKSKMIFLGMGFPILTKLPWFKWHTYEKHRLRAKAINQYIVDCVNKASEGYNVDDEPTCFVHAYRQKMGKSNEFLDEGNLLATCADFFLAGQETTTTTLRWAMLILANEQEAQEKLRAEVLSVVGSDSLPSMSDQTKMPYARAFVYELQRYANILGRNVPHVTVRDTEIGGHFIPEGTLVNGDIHYVMAHDPLFENPREFRPERYLNEDGKTLRKELVDRTVAFSLGKRVCAGEGLARAELFLGLLTTVQRYRLTPSPGKPLNMEPKPQAIKMPQEQTIRLERV